MAGGGHVTGSPAGPHQSTGPQSCSCGTPGFISTLTCGHETWTHGEPADISRRGGAWLSCQWEQPGGGHGCQAQRRIMSVRPVTTTEE
jgi:hypothetical protein